ncbi:metallophosphoesterase [Geitlerinema sp. PCC 7407]|uniref:metallophosphoesterase family protein n=1 Tax=Geitlerinema sp. PCC 7407 TaxID=1173025 RepID=UPI00029FAD7E|nr:metallophosphoesterase [Geitlerinema sp. PCC 7407]AFY67340.1 metallophosphoesterase [Geitlerinema sp. PCC 7407]
MPPQPSPELLSDPFLQLPTADGVRVVWFTEFEGERHEVHYGPDLGQVAIAHTRRLSRTREDQNSQISVQNLTLPLNGQPVPRAIWRHEATITGLRAGERVPYRVVSVHQDGQTARSEVFALGPLPRPEAPLKILLTSDHQLKPMTAANAQKVVETVGPVDAVWFAGDLVNVPDRASEWFDDRRGNAFFPVLQGRAHYSVGEGDRAVTYRGGALIQSAPLYAAIGNHEVMGRFSGDRSLNSQFADPVPRAIAAAQAEPMDFADPAERDRWLENQSFNTKTYEEIFTLPRSPSGDQRYYAVTFGSVRLVVLYVTQIWRSPSREPTIRGRYQERTQDLENPQQWGHGQHIFEPISAGSPQYRWLQTELASPEFQQARYRVVMLHHPPHSLGENSVPPFTDPVAVRQYATDGALTAIRYEYPPERDYLIRDLVPLLEEAGTDLVFYGHSHLWNRFRSDRGLHFLETSNVGNSYGAYVGDLRRPVPTDHSVSYAATGNPNGLAPVMPTIAPLLDAQGQPQPYIASNHITVFSVFETATGTISSYRFDTLRPDSPVIKFDAFSLGRPAP